MRLIDADALMKSIGCEDATKYGNKTAEQQHNSYSTMMMYEIADEIDDAPTIDAEPVRHGTWEDVNSAYWRWYPEGARVVNRVTYRCSRCGRGAITKTDYCTCGAKMDGGGEK